MYNPHEAKEDTVLFPAFRKLVSQNEYDSLGEAFEKNEHKLFGEDGFEVIVNKVASIEKSLVYMTCLSLRQGCSSFP